jgi:hypothetical protein
MADHLHKQIRAALVTKLTGLTTTGARVYANRLQPMQDANLPGLRIFAAEERSEPVTLADPHVQSRELVVVIEGCSKKVSGLDDELDLISKEVETALAAGITVGTANLAAYYTGMNYDDEQLDKPVGVKRMTFSIPFRAMSNAPDVLI